MTVLSDEAIGPVPAETTIPGGFREFVIAKYFKPDLPATVGLEFEAGGLRIPEVVEILRSSLSAPQSEYRRTYWGFAHYIRTEFGNIRVEPADHNHVLNACERIGRSTLLERLPRLARCVHRLERTVTLFEVVTDPLSLSQVESFALVLDDLGLAGGKGTGLFRPVSTQVNVGIDPSDTLLLKNLLADYYGNHTAIRRDLQPHPGRLKFIRPIHPAFLRKLRETAWRPDYEELSAWYRRYSRWKASSIELSYALQPSKANQTMWGKLVGRASYPSRPVVEFREANTITSTRLDPHKTSRQVMHEIRFAVAMVEAARQAMARERSQAV